MPVFACFDSLLISSFQQSVLLWIVMYDVKLLFWLRAGSGPVDQDPMSVTPASLVVFGANLQHGPICKQIQVVPSLHTT